MRGHAGDERVAALAVGTAKAGPTMGQAGQMNEIEPFAAAEAVEVAGDRGRDAGVFDRDAEGHQAIETEDRVVEVGLAVAVSKAARVLELTAKKGFDEGRRITQQLRCEPRYLQRFESRTHCTSP